jgi:hypothetical protein
MTPEDYIREIVLPTALEFKEKPRSRRHAYLTCMALFHVKDHLNEAGEVSIEDKNAGSHWQIFSTASPRPIEEREMSEHDGMS